MIRRPLEVIRPERRIPDINFVRNGLPDATNPAVNCPASFLMTLQQVDDDHKLRGDDDPEAKFEEELRRELPGVSLRNGMWKIESPAKGNEAHAAKVVFSREVPEYHLKITKTYELEKVAADRAGPRHSRPIPTPSPT